MKGVWSNITKYMTDIFIFLIIVLFPLMVDETGFFNILDCKFECFITISCIYLGSITLIVIYNLIRKNNILNKKLSKIQIIGLIFLVTLTLMMCVFRFRGVSLRFFFACAFGLFISIIFDLL